MNNTLPIYITGVFTGIVFEVGYLNTQITPIYDGYATMNKVTYSPAGGFMINKKMKELLLAENFHSWKISNSSSPKFCTNSRV